VSPPDHSLAADWNWNPAIYLDQYFSIKLCESILNKTRKEGEIFEISRKYWYMPILVRAGNPRRVLKFGLLGEVYFHRQLLPSGFLTTSDLGFGARVSL